MEKDNEDDKIKFDLDDDYSSNFDDNRDSEISEIELNREHKK